MPHSLYLVLVDFFPPYSSISVILDNAGLVQNCVGMWRDRVYTLPSSPADATRVHRKLSARFDEVARVARERMHDDPFSTQHVVALESRV